ncbi:hypothetical protein FANTH_10000 [Fusarium anthophilum]|uniref:Uncharacterized protein n=1 Tax=Fusarium anthophilum TaxID=48485 RepID=A0A8H4Z491_9HYPO|nr:hypothetical protein FANTH_10000 [Fusarium anthophilum]
MSQPDSPTKSMYLHTIWGRRPMNTMQRLLALLIPWAETKLLNFIKKYEIHYRDFWDDGLRLTVPLGNKTPLRALADLATLMEVEGLDKDWEFVSQSTPEKNTKDFIIKHKICWNRQWEDKLRLTMPLKGKSPEETLADLVALMQDEGMDQYWKYVTQVLTDDPRKVEKVEQIK